MSADIIEMVGINLVNQGSVHNKLYYGLNNVSTRNWHQIIPLPRISIVVSILLIYLLTTRLMVGILNPAAYSM